MAGNQNSPKMLQILLGWGKTSLSLATSWGKGKAKPSLLLSGCTSMQSCRDAQAVLQPVQSQAASREAVRLYFGGSW